MHLFLLSAYRGAVCIHCHVVSVCLGGHSVCIFTWYPNGWGSICVHFYMLSPCLGARCIQFFVAFRMSGVYFVCVFTWYPHVWEALCMHFHLVSGYPRAFCIHFNMVLTCLLGQCPCIFFVVSACLGGTLYACLRGIRMFGIHFVFLFV